MRLFALLALLLILQLAIANTYYDAKTCGISTLSKARKGRSLEDTRETTDEEEEEVEDEEEEVTRAGEQTTLKPEDNDDDDDDGEKKKDEAITEKVMGGTNAKLGELPWAVMIKVLHPDKKFTLCGGTLISTRHVITAAHCFRKVEGNIGKCTSADLYTDQEVVANARVFVGGICARKKDDDKCKDREEGELRRIRRLALRHQFVATGCHRSMWDVALLELDEMVDGPHACLPHLHNMDSFKINQTPLISFGFGGDPIHDIKMQKTLQKIELGTALDRNHCTSAWTLSFRNVICTRESATKNVCQGDSGGGILAVHNGRTFLVGVISFGSSCNDGINNAMIGNAQVNMDINLYTATIDKYIGTQTPNHYDEWNDV